MAKRKFDIVLFGATGFTGQLTAEYLLRKMNSEDFTLALAARNEHKLAEIIADLSHQFPDKKIESLIADSSDAASLNAMCAQAKVVLSTVGPYAKYGIPLVEACVKNKTDYIDITGEGNFVSQIMRDYGEEAEKNKVRIVNCCGFDSIPADMGVYYSIKQLGANSSNITSIKGYAQFASSGWNPLASVSGGTWHSAINFMRIPEIMRQQGTMRKIKQEAKKNSRKVEALSPQVHYIQESQAWGVPLPIIDNEVVLRSAAGIKEYGQAFYYGHHAQMNSIVSLAAGAIGTASVFTLAQLKATRQLLLNLRQPGQGPDMEQRSKNQFKLRFITRNDQEKLITEVSGNDPGYGETSKMVSESALCLALDRKKLPRRYGILTPVLAMQDLLLERLQEAGIRFELIERKKL